MHGIANDKMLNQFFFRLEPIIGHEVLRENLQTFGKACVLAQQISKVSNLVGGSGTCSKWCEPPDYAPMELYSMVAG